MSELDKIANKVMIKIGGREREIRFGFSAWAKIEKEYGGIQKIEKLEKDIESRPFEVLPHLLYIGLVDKEGIDEETILDDYGLGDIEYISNKFAEALYGSLPIDEGKKAGKEAKK